jgi:hypothetical protein
MRTEQRNGMTHGTIAAVILCDLMRGKKMRGQTGTIQVEK